MYIQSGNNDISVWLELVRAEFLKRAPTLITLFDTYSAEAQFGRRYINSDLELLRPGARILEIGAGTLLLSCQLVREGFDVIALEPLGDGFSHFDKMRQLILDIAYSWGFYPKLIEMPAEKLESVYQFDYVFSINVMEHVHDVKTVLEKVGNKLAVGERYRFTCPNYLFPYEPHFNIPTFFSKRLTELVLGWKIFGSKKVTDPVGTWKSLNWINVSQIKFAVSQISGLEVSFSRTMLVSALERISLDVEFADRRSPLIRGLVLILVRTRIYLYFSFIPAVMQPIIDCSIQKIHKTDMQ